MVSSCSLLDPIIYKLPIQQGNIIDQEQVDKLRLDMSKEQVSFVLGTPMVQDAFDADRWEYLYLLNKRNGGQIKKTLVLNFKSGRLAEVTSNDYKLNEIYPERAKKVTEGKPTK